jgi:hypothetical protein
MPEATGTEIERRGIRDVIAIADFVEKLIQSEQQWIMNRLQWLFTSQSFLLTAYGVLVTRGGTAPYEALAKLLVSLLPWVGLCFCILVGIAIFAAECVLSPLGDTRHSLTVAINEHSTMPRDEKGNTIKIPIVGTKKRKTRFFGGLPHWFLPWILAILWLTLLLARFGIVHNWTILQSPWLH